MSEAKCCPLGKLGTAVSEYMCQENDCAWWLVGYQECSITVLAAAMVVQAEEDAVQTTLMHKQGKVVPC